MSVEAVDVFLKENNKAIDILSFEDTSTVAKAAEALRVTPGEIAKSLLFKIKDGFVMINLFGLFVTSLRSCFSGSRCTEYRNQVEN